MRKIVTYDYESKDGEYCVQYWPDGKEINITDIAIWSEKLNDFTFVCLARFKKNHNNAYLQLIQDIYEWHYNGDGYQDEFEEENVEPLTQEELDLLRIE